MDLYNFLEQFNYNQLIRIANQILHMDLPSLGGTYAGIIVIIMLVLATLLIYFGYKAHQTIIQGAGFIAGFVFGVLLVGGFTYNVEGGVAVVIMILAGVLAGALGAILGLLLSYVLVFLGGALGTGLLISFFLGMDQLQVTNPVVIIAGAAGGILAVSIYKIVCILLTSFAGSILMLTVLNGSSLYGVLYNQPVYIPGNSRYIQFWFFLLSGIIVQLITLYYLFADGSDKENVTQGQKKGKLRGRSGELAE